MPSAGEEIAGSKKLVVTPSSFTLQRVKRYLSLAMATRFIAVGGVLVAIFMRVGQMPSSNVRLILILAGFEMVANVSYFAIGFRRWPAGAFHVSGLIDIVAIGVLVAVTGGSFSEFIVLYALVIVFNGVFYGLPGMLSATFPSMVSLVIAALAAPESISIAPIAVELGVFGALGYLSVKVGENEKADRLQIAESAVRTERQAQQIQALYETSTTIGSHYEAEALLSTAVERTHELAIEMWGADLVTSITLMDPLREEMIVARIEGEDPHARPSDRFPLSAMHPEVLERLMSGRPYFVSSDEMGELRSRFNLPEGATAIAAPISLSGEVLGALAVRSNRGAVPSAEQLDILHAISNHVASALARVRALQDEKQRREEATALFELARELNSITDLNAVLSRISEAGARLARVDTCAMALLNADGAGIDPNLGAIAAIDGDVRVTIEDLAPLAIDEISQALVERRPVQITDHGTSSEGARRAAELLGVRACLIIPILSHERPLGMLCFGYRNANRKFSIEQMQLGEAIAGLAAVTIENVNLHKSQQETVSQLRELDRLKTEFVSTASHELRSPLTSISGFAHTLLRHGPNLSEEERTDFLTVINQQAKQLARLIDELLTVSRIEEGRLALSFRKIDVTRLAKDCIDAARLRSDKHQFNTDFPPDFPPVVADEGKLSDILRNLVDNALKYSPEGGRVEIGGKVAGREAIIWVSDEGAGIPEKDLAAVFEKFYQVAGRPDAPGTGLGLYIVAQLIKAHDGRMWVESQEGRGSTFFFALPQRRASDLLALTPPSGVQG